MRILEIVCRAVEKIVFSEIDGTTLILPLILLLWFIWGQAKDCIKITKRILKEDKVTSK